MSTGTPLPDTQVGRTGSPLANTSLRIHTHAVGSNPEGPLFLVVNLDTKVGELKQRLQAEHSLRPSPATQRLIYHGQALQNDNVPLRSILRAASSSSTEHGATHVVYLVIKNDEHGPALQSAASRPPSLPQISPPAIPQQSGLPAQPQIQQPNFHLHGHLPNLAPFNIQNMVQQHMNLHLQHHHQHQHQHHQQRDNSSTGLQQAPGVNFIPNSTPANPPPLQGETGPPFMTPATHPGQQPSSLPPGPQTHQTSNFMTRVQEVIGPNGERIRTVVNSNSPFGHPHLQPQGSPAPPSAPTQTGTPRTGTPTPSGAQSTQPTALHHFHGLAPVPPFPGFGRPFPSIPPMIAPAVPPTPSSNPLVWLLSSPAGPQALIFAPGHGFFSSNQALGNSALSNPIQAEARALNTPIPQVLPNQQTDVAQDANANRDQGAIEPQGVPVARAEPVVEQAQAQQLPQPGPQNEDLLSLIFRRGWLFLRLYMFIFVLSEPGTWRRIILLGLAVFVCLLPPQNPLTDFLNATRRHIDTLIGPPQAPTAEHAREARNNGAGRPNGRVNDPRPAVGADSERPNPAQQNSDAAANQHQGRRGGQRDATSLPTPEQYARRLLREHEERTPSFTRRVLYPIEQAIALFLASLIPGVGERHVQAREEARRIVAEEEQRRLREEAEANNEGESQNDAQSATAIGETDDGNPAEKDVGGSSSKNKNMTERLPSQVADEEESAPTATSSGIEATSSSDNNGVGIRHRLSSE